MSAVIIGSRILHAHCHASWTVPLHPSDPVGWTVPLIHLIGWTVHLVYHVSWIAFLSHPAILLVTQDSPSHMFYQLGGSSRGDHQLDDVDCSSLISG